MAIVQCHSNGLPLQIDTQIGLRRKRQMRMALIWGGFLLFAAWCLNGTIVEDTDWSRIGGRNGVFASLGRYLTIDWTLLPELIVPTIETFMMASVGTVLGCFFFTARGVVGGSKRDP